LCIGTVVTNGINVTSGSIDSWSNVSMIGWLNVGWSIDRWSNVSMINWLNVGWSIDRWSNVSMINWLDVDC
jgi:hypothetical protein